MGFGYEICIPSYRRPGESKTLDYLELLDVPKEKITMSVQTQEDLEAYKRSGLADRVGSLVFREKDSAGDNRNTLLDSFRQGTKIVFMDDDVRCIKRLIIYKGTGKRRLEPVKTQEGFERICELGFRAASFYRTVGFGLCVYNNAMFMRGGLTARSLCMTDFMGIVNTDIRFDGRLKIFEDSDFCAQVIKRYGKFICLNSYTVDSLRKNEGGCKEDWAEQGKYARILMAKHGDILEVDTSRTICSRLRKEVRR